MAVFESSGCISENNLQAGLKLVIDSGFLPESLFEVDSSFEIDTFIRLDSSPTVENTGFGLKVNNEQIFLVSLDQQKDGTKILSFINPWQPMRLLYAFESSTDLINYQVS